MRKRMLISFLFMSILLTGCWDSEELNDVSIVTGIAVDPGGEKKYKLTVEVVNSTEFTKQSAQGDAPIITYSFEGNSLSELSNKMNVGLDRKLIYSHTRVLFINEKIAEKEVFGFLDFLERSGHFRNDFNIVITLGNEAADFTKVTFPSQKIPALKLHKQANTFLEEWGGDPHVRLTDFISAIISKGRDPVASTVVLVGDKQKGSTTENNKSLEPGAIVTITGLAVFDDEKMLGHLPLEDTRSYLWTQDLKHTSLSLPCGEEGESGNDNPHYLDIRVIYSYSKINVHYKNGAPELEVIINGEAKIQGSECQNDLTKLETYLQYENKMENFVEKDITTMIEKVQKEFGTDIFGFGEALNRQHPKKFEEVKGKWNEEFSKGTVKVKVDIDLLRSGIKGKSFMRDLPSHE